MPINETLETVIASSTIGAIVAGAIFLALVVLLGIWIYTALAWISIGKKLNYKLTWLAWIPFARTAMILELGGFHWAFVFFWLVPILGWIAILILLIISIWKVFEKRKYPGLFSLSLVIPKVGSILYLIALGFVAWKDKKSSKKVQKSSKKRR